MRGPAEEAYERFVAEQRRFVGSEAGRAELDFWTRELAGELPLLALPMRTGAGAPQRFQGGVVSFELGPNLTRRCREAAREAGVTAFTFFLAAYGLLLHRYTNQTDIVIGAPSLGRHAAEHRNVIGYFINMLALRCSVPADSSFEGLLSEAKRKTHAALEHQRYPFPLLVRAVNTRRHRGRPPVFQAVLNWLRAETATRVRLRSGEELETLSLPQQLGQFDLELVLTEGDDDIAVELKYDSDRFTAQDMARLGRSFERLLRAALDEPRRRIDELPVLHERDHDQIVHAWNGSSRVDLAEIRIEALFERQAIATPDAVAVTFGASTYTYVTLRDRARAVAHALHGSGIGRGDHVALWMSRDADLVPAMLGALMAGCAFVLLDRETPSARRGLAMAEANLRAVLTREALRSEVGDALSRCQTDRCEVIAVDGLAVQGERVDLVAGDEARGEPSAGDVACVLFTSEANANPEGVVVRHRSVVNVIDWVNKTFHVSPADCLLLTASLGDARVVYDILGVLAAGGSVLVASEDQVADPPRLLELLCAGEVTIWDSAPALVETVRAVLEVVGNRRSRLRLVLLSGGRIPVELPQDLRRKFPNARVVALGEATEATLWWSHLEVSTTPPEWTQIPFGRPIQNVRCYVLNAALQPCSVHVPGELYIGGECLASGYLRHATETQGRFIPDPFSKIPGARIYRSKEMVRFDEEGRIERLGSAGTPVRDGVDVSRGLLVLRSTGPGSAVFCVHPISGSAICYAPLLKVFDGPVYGLHALGFAGQPLDAVPSMAKRYLRAVRNVQPRGPYVLLGWSFGGLVAYEMTLQLEAEGESVDRLMLVDSYLSSRAAFAADGDGDLEALHMYLREVERSNGMTLPTAVWERTRELPADEASRALLRAAGEHLRVAESELEQRARVFRANAIAYVQYRPRRSVAADLLHVAAEVPAGTTPASGGEEWRGFSRGHFQAIRAPGDHYSMMRVDNVVRWGRALQKTPTLCAIPADERRTG